MPRWLLVALFGRPKRSRGIVMFDHPPHGTDCARCPKSYINACTDCAARVYAAQKAIVIEGRAVTFLAAAPAAWAAKYGSEVFTGYAPGAR